MFNKAMEVVKEYSHIIIYRHVNPDLDAFGSQFGVYAMLKESFPDKTISLDGEFTSDLVDKFEIEINTTMPDFSSHKVLAIVVDTANKERIDGASLKNCTTILKIDHHIVVDNYGDINIADSTASSASQLVCQWYDEYRQELVLPKSGAAALYLGIIGDTNRFMYKGTDQRTFGMAKVLLETGIDIDVLYQSLYLKKASELDVQRHILNVFKVDGQVAYYILQKEDLALLNISREKGSNYVNLLAGVEEFQVWLAITENEVDKNWRISIRSRKVEINEVAAMFNGGGHALASGATLSSLEELPKLLQEINQRIQQIQL